FLAELRPYQQEGYDWLSFLYENKLGGVLADDMGLGKTVQSLAMIGRAIEQAEARGEERPRFLVVAPTSVVPNCVAESNRFLPIAAPGLFPSPTGFQEHYAKPIEKEGDRERLQQLQRRIRPLLLRRTKELVASDLPPKTEQVIEVVLGPKQRAVYDRHLNRERQRVLGLIGEFDRNRFTIFRALTT